jgi:ABC-type transport system substrate-binding protein
VEDGLGLQLTLVQGFHWADGVPITAQDICFTVDAILEPANQLGGWLGPFRDALAGCEVLKPDLVVIRTKRALPDPRGAAGFFVLPAHRFESSLVPPDHAIGHEAWGSRGVHAQLSAQGLEVAVVAQGVDRVPWNLTHIRIEPPTSHSVADLLAGRVHGLVSVDRADWEAVRANDDVALRSYDLRSWWFVAVNHRGVLGDVGLRRALDQLLDRAALKAALFAVHPDDSNPPVELISGPYVQSSGHYNRSVAVREHDREAGVLALERAGRPTLRLGIAHAEHQAAPLLLEALANQLRAGGLEVSTQVVGGNPWAWSPDPLKGEVDLLVGRVTEPIRWMEHHRGHLFGTGGSHNPFQLSVPAVDELLAAAAVARTDTQEHDAGHGLHALLAQDAHALFLWKADTKSAWRTELRVTLTPGPYWTDVDGWARR